MKILSKYSLLPTQSIPVLACSGTPELVLRRKGSYGYLSASSTAFNRTSPVPPPGILVQNTG